MQYVYDWTMNINGTLEQNCSQYTVLCQKQEGRKEEPVCSFYEKAIYQRRSKSLLGLFDPARIHNVRNYRKAWSESRAQYLVRLQELMTCQRFELIGTFLHIVTIEEEEASTEDQLRKIRPLYDHIKRRCFDLYQPLQHSLSIREW